MIRKCKATTIGLGLLAILFSVVARAEVGAPQLSPEYHKWLKEDVRWIITDQERKDFLHLATDSDRDKFVVNFWERRNPISGSKTNVFKEEHYRRLAFANEHFAASVPGWRTDRGRIYVIYGPPDSVTIGIRPADGVPVQEWHYKHMKGGDDDVTLNFADECRCGHFYLQNEPPNRGGDMSR